MPDEGLRDRFRVEINERPDIPASHVTCYEPLNLTVIVSFEGLNDSRMLRGECFSEHMDLTGKVGCVGVGEVAFQFAELDRDQPFTELIPQSGFVSFVKLSMKFVSIAPVDSKVRVTERTFAELLDLVVGLAEIDA